MPIYEIIGLQHRTYTNKAGKDVNGWNVFLCYDDDKIEGHGADRVWVGNDDFMNWGLKLGDIVKLYYNRYGSVSYIERVD